MRSESDEATTATPILPFDAGDDNHHHTDITLSIRLLSDIAEQENL